MASTDDLWCVLAIDGTYLRVREVRDHFIPAGDLDRFRRHSREGYVGLCPRSSNATDGQAQAPVVWCHYQHHSKSRPPGIPALIYDHGNGMRTAIWWLQKPLPRPKHPDDCWLAKANRRLAYKLSGGQSAKPPSTDPLWLMPPGKLIHRQAHQSTNTFLSVLKPSPWERDAHKRPARQH
jgi:hypothetical protein